jgi:DNA-binding PadR family transcriptional regulator
MKMPKNQREVNTRIALPEERFIREAQRLIDRHPPFYGQTPDVLLKSPRIKPPPKTLFGLLHSHAACKDLKANCVAKVGMETLSDEMGLDECNIGHWLKHLEAEGWITIIRRGKRRVNWYRLWPVSQKTFAAMVAHHRVQYRLKTDYGLCQRLSESLYPDRAKSPDHAPEEYEKLAVDAAEDAESDQAKSPVLLNK